jgi:protein O-GlcNAc transferase
MIDAPARPDTAQVPVVVLLQQGIALYRQGNMPAAEDVFTRVLLADPGNPHALHILGLICEKRGDLEMAQRLIERSIQMQPHSRVYLNLGVIQQHRGDLNAAIAAYRQAIALEPDYAEAWTNLLFSLDLHPQQTPGMLRTEREAFDRAVCARLAALAPPHPNDRDPDRRLRVGYVGGDFRARHSASMSFGWLLDHDPEAVEVYLYSTYNGDDPTSAAFKARADVWCEVGELSPPELVSVIREDQIDILVDLGGAAQGGRTLVFACKPAPIQVGGWGYPHGLGISAMDYMVGDPIAIPRQYAHYYPERILTLPCLMGYRPDGILPDVGTAPQPRQGYRTYGYLGRAMKLNEPTLATWAEILRSDPTGRLLLKSPQYGDRAMRERITNTLVALGVASERIEVHAVETSRADHLLAHREIDVALEPFPHGSGQTAIDSCLMGVPTVALLGEAVSGRISASILTVLGMSAWITRSQQEYAELARLGHAPNREWFRDRLLGSVIADGPQYAQAVEVAYRECWRRWCQEREAAA